MVVQHLLRIEHVVELSVLLHDINHTFLINNSNFLMDKLVQKISFPSFTCRLIQNQYSVRDDQQLLPIITV